MRISDWSSDVCSSDLDALVSLLEIDAIKAIADQVGGLQRQFHDIAWRLLDAQGAEAALGETPAIAVLDDLPVTARHEILAGIDRLPAQDADAPEIGKAHV